MDDDTIINRGGTAEDIDAYAEQNGASGTEPSRQEQAWGFINSTFLKLIMSDKKVPYEVKKSIEAFWIDLFATNAVRENMIQAVNNFLWEIDIKVDSARRAGIQQLNDAITGRFLELPQEGTVERAIVKTVTFTAKQLLDAENSPEEMIQDIENTDLSEVGGGDEDDSPIV